MFKAPDHQVAGHSAHAGKLGPLVDDSGRFYKPLQSNGRGAKELSFYTSFASDPRVPNQIRRYFPVFYGTQLVEASDGSGLQPHIIMEDLMQGLRHPSVVDIKVGARTWYPEASEEYIEKCLKKDRETVTPKLGFRVSGLQIHDSSRGGSAFWRPARKQVSSFRVEDVRLVLRKFVSSNPSSSSEPDRAYASEVYGGSDGILAQLLELKAWFEDQTNYHFCSASVLMICEKDDGSTAEDGKKMINGKVKLIDFAHVLDGEGIIDHNFLGGLCSLIKFISEILALPTDA